MIPLGVLASARVAAAGGGGSPLEYLGFARVSGSATSYTFDDVPVGDAAADRSIIVVSYAREKIVSAVTIGGVSATIDQADAIVGISRAALASGTTADIVVEYPTAANTAGCTIFIYRAIGTVSKRTSAAVEGRWSSGTGGGSLTLTGVQPGDYIIAGNYGHYNATYAGSCEWSGTAGVAEDYDIAAGNAVSGASAQATTSGNLTITTKWGAVYYPRLAAVAYTIN